MFLVFNLVKYLMVFIFSFWVDGLLYMIIVLGCSCSVEIVYRWFIFFLIVVCSVSVLLWLVIRIMIFCVFSRVLILIVSVYLGI